MKSRAVPPRRSPDAGFGRSSLTQAIRQAFGFRKSRVAEDAFPVRRSNVEFETLEPRLLLSADLPVLPVLAALTDQQDTTPVIVAAPGVEHPAVNFVATGSTAPASPFAGQTIYLDLNGAEALTYRGPVTVDGIDMPAFAAPAALQGQEEAITAALVDALEKSFDGTGLLITTERPDDGGRRTPPYI